jgi:hypothetical protein
MNFKIEPTITINEGPVHLEVLRLVKLHIYIDTVTLKPSPKRILVIENSPAEEWRLSLEQVTVRLFNRISKLSARQLEVFTKSNHPDAKDFLVWKKLQKSQLVKKKRNRPIRWGKLPILRKNHL